MPKEIDAMIERLVDTRYIYEVENILREIEDPKVLVTVVSAALCRTSERGYVRGYDAKAADVRQRLAL
jgi:hypothetical protein